MVSNNIVDDSSEDFEPLIFDIEEVECRMTDTEERDKSDDNTVNRSVRGSIFNSPKDFPMINPSRVMNESQMSMLSQSNLSLFDKNNMRQI